MIIQYELRIYPSRKYIMTPSNTTNYDEIKKMIDILIIDNNDIPESILDKMYDHLRTTFLSKNVFCFGKDLETDDICIFEFDVKADCAFKIAGFDEKGTPYIEMLN